ncbi:hypothetical protein ACM55I_12615 [Flavobacterium sp. GB2R13]
MTSLLLSFASHNSRLSIHNYKKRACTETLTQNKETAQALYR